MDRRKCTMCDNFLDEYDLQQPFEFDHVVGYGSVHDLTHFGIRLCNDCFDKVMAFVLPRCKRNPVINENVGFLDTIDKTPIQAEKEHSLFHRPSTVEFEGHTLVELTRRNVGCIEAMIATDSAYRLSGSKQAGPVTNRRGKIIYPGSSAYWITRMSEEFTRENIRQAVETVDRENSTHLNADLVGRNEMVDRLYAIGLDELKKKLWNRDFGVYDILVAPTHPMQEGYKARENVSFAAKFCHYFCLNVFEDQPEADNFSIWDNEVADVLPWYLTYWDIPVPKDLRNYKDYSDSIDSLRRKTGVSRNGFDHLLWYFHKGDR